jgi:RNA polymerase sigma-70 factor, ECF subfamily
LQGIDHTGIALWVTAAQRGSPEAFENLHRHFVALVHGVLLSRFRPAVAEELTQECFLIAFKKLRQLRDPAKFGPWIVTIARRMEASTESMESIAQERDEPADPRHDPESAADAATILSVIRAMPEAYRETLALRLVEGMSGAEIAAATDMSPESVRVNLHRGMKKLRELLSIDIHGSRDTGEQP